MAIIPLAVIALCVTLLAMLPVFGPTVVARTGCLGWLGRRWRWWFFAAAVIALLGSFYEYYTAKRELFRLSPTDIQLRVRSVVRASHIPIGVRDPRLIPFAATLGDAYIVAELSNVGDSIIRAVHPRSAGYDYRVHGLAPKDKHICIYYASNLTVGGFENYPYLADLDGVTLSCLLPIDELELVTGAWSHRLDIYIMGRQFGAEADIAGHVNFEIDL